MTDKRKKKVQKAKKQKNHAESELETVWISLLEMFAAVDDVMTEADAFSEQKIYKSLGRIYRQWLNSREALDPGFDRQRYRHEMKSKASKKKRTTPLGRELPAQEPRRSSSAITLTSAKSRKTSAGQEKPSAKRSAKRARSDSRASGGRSSTARSSASGAASRSAKGKGSASGSSGRATRKSPRETR